MARKNVGAPGGAGLECGVFRASLPTVVIDNFTIGFWFRTGASDNAIKVHIGDPNLNGYGVGLSTTGTIQVLHGGLAFIPGGSQGTNGIWHSAIYRRTAGTGQMYLDGVASGASFPDTPSVPTGEFFIGQCYDPTSSAGVEGCEAFIYDRALTNAEVISIGTGHYSPLWYPTNLKEYFVVTGWIAPEISYAGTGATAVLRQTDGLFSQSDHPSIVYPVQLGQTVVPYKYGAGPQPWRKVFPQPQVWYGPPAASAGITVFRKTLSGIGTRTGSRQTHNS